MKAILKLLHFSLFVTLVSAACHYLFSWIGFNPTDDGFVLSAARRILNGEIPHLDFLSLRPAGSAYLHAPVVKYGGESTFMISRLVFWIQSAVIAWTWVAIADKMVRLGISGINRYMLALIVFVFNVHSFPAMAWTTVDGLFFASLGLWLITHFNKNGNQVGYLLLGCAALCKQNFLVMIPGVFIIMGHFKRPYYLLDALTPAILYALLLWRNDALHLLTDQLFSRRELLETGVIAYVGEPAFYAGLVLPIVINVFRKKYKGFLRNIDFILAFDLVLLGAAAIILDVFTGDFSFALFGFLTGYTVVHIKRRGVILYNALTLLTAWTVSISLGYNSPALATGLIIAALLTINFDRELFSLGNRIKYPVAAAVLIFVTGAFAYARYQHVYKEQPGSRLTAKLGEVFDGARGIRTNEQVYASFRELDSLQSVYGASLAIVPDYAAWWVTSEYPNPLNMDWPNIGEMASESITFPFEQHLLAGQGKTVVALQKYRASEYARGLRPLEDESMQFPAADMVRRHMLRIGETRYFYLYQ